MSVTARQVVEALKSRYVETDPTSPNVTASDVADFFRSMPDDMVPLDHSLLEVVANNKSDWVISGSDIAILHSVRDCMNMIFNLIDLDDEISDRLRLVTPIISAELLENPSAPLDAVRFSIFTILDLLIDATIGWASDQGRAGEKLLTEVNTVIDALHSGDPDFQALESNLKAFLDKEQGRIHKLEERLAASESGKLRSQKGRTIAAQMINEAIESNQLTMSIAKFLKGPWYESMQLLAITRGIDGDDWVRASKLTETIVWTYQPIDEADQTKANTTKQRLYRIIEHLPTEIRDLLLALEHSGDETESAMNAIDEDHVAIVSGQALEYIDVEPLEVEGNVLIERTSVSRILLRKVTNLEPGQWFTFNEGEKSARIKLVLKLEDIKQLLFTNRNGMKALEKSFDEMAYLMSSSVVKPLNHSAVFSSTFAAIYQGLVDEHQKKLKRAEQADVEQAHKEAERERAIQEANMLARAKEEEAQRQKDAAKEDRLNQAKQEAAKSENQGKVQELTKVVASLNVGAWLTLPAADGQMEECKLAVRVGEKLIFVSRTGVKVGDYSSEQLITLLVAGQGKIEDAGVEFEDTLAQVVSKLRQDRNKSYDDLTGS